MSTTTMRDEAFWKLIETLDSAGVLTHVMIIGTWAEWLYTDYFEAITGNADLHVDIGKTHDIDVYFRNYLMEIEGADRFKEEMLRAGFMPGSDFKGTYFYGGIEVEFLAGTAGVGKGIIEIPSVGIKAERLEDLALLEPTWVEKRGFRICIPSPASYVIQKLYINPKRRPENKRAQDIRKVDVLVRAMRTVPGQLEHLGELIANLPRDKAEAVRMVADQNGIVLHRET